MQLELEFTLHIVSILLWEEILPQRINPKSVAFVLEWVLCQKEIGNFTGDFLQDCASTSLSLNNYCQNEAST